MFGLIRLMALRELRGGWRLLGIAAALIVVAGALAALPIVFRTTLADRALAQLLEQQPDATLTILHERLRRPATEEDVRAVDQALAGAIAARIPDLAGAPVRVTTSTGGPLRIPASATGVETSVNSRFQVFEDLERNVRVVEGRFIAGSDAAGTPDDPIPVMIGAAGAATLGLVLGDHVSFRSAEADADRPESVSLAIAGLVEPADVEAPAFHGVDNWFQLAETPGMPPVVTLGIFVTERQLLDAMAPLLPSLRLRHDIHLPLDPFGLNSSTAGAGRTALAAFEQALQREPASQVTVPLIDVLIRYDREAEFNTSQTLLAGLQLVAVALFAVALLGRRVADRARDDRARLAGRGARPWQQVGAQALLGVVVSVPAALLGAPLAAFALHHAGQLEVLERLSGGQALDTRLIADAWLLAVGGAIATWVAFTLPSWFESRTAVDERRRQRGRPGGLSLVHRYYLDIALFAVAGILFFQFDSEASGGQFAAFEGSGVDPVLLISPGLMLLGAALVLMRLLPPILNVLGVLLQRLNAPTWAVLGLLTPARNPGGPLFLMALLIFVSAIGLVAATYSETIAETETERIAYQVGADIRGVAIGGNLAGGSPARALQPLDDRSGVDAAGVAFRGVGSIGADRSGSRAILLAVQTDRFDEILTVDPAFLDRPLPDLLDAIALEPGLPGVAIPEEAEELSVWVRTDPAAPGIGITARVVDARGQVRRLEMGTPAGGAWERLTTPLISSGTPIQAPARFLALGFRPIGQGVRAPGGTIWFDDLSAGGAVLEAFDDGAPWFSANGGVGGDRAVIDAEQRRDGDASMQYRWTGLRTTDERLLVRESPNLPAPAAMDSASMRAAGLELGDVIPFGFSDFIVPIRLVAALELFPTLNPANGGMVVTDFLALRVAAAVASARAGLPITEVWVETQTPEARASVRQLMDDVYLTSTVLDAPAQLAAARTDPFRAGGIEALFFIGFVGLLGIGGVTLVVSLAASAQERAHEFAILETLGYGRVAATCQVVAEVALVLLIGAGLGFALGRAIASALLGFLDITNEGIRAVPPFVLRTDWTVAGFGIAALIVGGLAGIAVVGRWVAGRRPARVLRNVGN